MTDPSDKKLTMKKLLLLASLLATTGSLLAQGRVAFSNAGLPGQYKISTNNANGTAPGFMTGTNGYRIGLYAGPVGTPEGSLALVGLATNARSASAAAAGYFNGGNPHALPAGYPPGTEITFQIRAWTFSTGMSWAQAVAADPLQVHARGVSALGMVMLAGDTPTPSLWTTYNPNGITGFTIAPGLPSSMGINLYAGLSITGAVGHTYALESVTNLGATNWTLVATNTFSTPGWFFIDTNTPFNPGSYFRVRLLP